METQAKPMLIAGAKDSLFLLPAMANRHGLVAGATGTGKTVTLQVMAEQFSAIGVPVFAADIKGDLSGISQPGVDSPKIQERVAKLKLADFRLRGSPVVFWDVFGKQGHPIRATVSEMGPLLFSRLLGLNDTQAGVLTLVFKIADDGGLLLLDLKDLQAMLQYVGTNAKDFQTQYGNISAASIGAIQRGLVSLEQEGGDIFFGEPALNLDDLMQTDTDGRGVVNILAADKLIHSPRLYATFLLWLLTTLFEHLPEAGDQEKPKLVFFFDEAHLLFTDLPKVIEDKVLQLVRLIRSKGVGVYFVTQNPIDIPEAILGQLGNRVQHALRAFTPNDQKAVRAAAQTFPHQSKIERRKSGDRIGDRRSPGFIPRRKRHADDRGAGAYRAARRTDWAGHTRAASANYEDVAGCWCLRYGRRSRVRIRVVEGARRADCFAAAGGNTKLSAGRCGGSRGKRTAEPDLVRRAVEHSDAADRENGSWR